MAAQADHHGAHTVGHQVEAGELHVAESVQRPANELFELLEVGLDQIGSSRDRQSERGAGRIDRDA